MNRRSFLIGSAALGWGAAGTSAGAGTGGSKRMTITEVRIYRVSIGGRNPVLVQIFTDAGPSGVGEAAVAYGTGAPAAAAMVKELAEGFVLGKDPFAIEALWSDMYDHSFWAKGGGSIIFAGIGAIEQALWDIKGKALDVPVYELLGGKVRDQVRVYANGWHYRSTAPAEFARDAQRVVKDGYSALKLYPLATPVMDVHGHVRHVAQRSIDRGAEDLAVNRVKAVREAVGPKIDLMLDVSVENGYLPISGRPGLGIELVEKQVKPFLWARCKV